MNSRNGKRTPLGKKPVSGLFDTLSVDFAGSLVMTRGENRFIIVSVAHLSKGLIAKALPSQAADVVVRFFVESIVANFGIP